VTDFKNNMHQYFTKEPKLLNDFKELLIAPKNIVITSHQNPDGDAFGSCLSLYALLHDMGHNVAVISPTSYADFLAWMPNVLKVKVFETQENSETQQLIENSDIIFCVDFSVLNRIKDMESFVFESNAQKVMIDHHQQPDSFADFVYWNEKASSTCELIYRLIEDLELEDNLSLDACTCIYTGILTDTGSFKYDSTSAEVHRIAGKLIDKGINPNQINRSLFDTNSFERLRFLGYALSQKLVYLPEYRIAYFKFSNEELQAYNSKSGDTEGIVNYGLSLKGVVMSAIFIEREDLIKISFRSVDSFSVSELSRAHFEGGGHHNAAGGKSNLSLEETVDKFLGLLPQYKEQLLAQP
jgi:phosphoesterase RecJ-like protein